MHKPDPEFDTTLSVDQSGKRTEDEDDDSLFYLHDKLLELKLLNAQLARERENDQRSSPD
jgi:hypothetical protein